MKSSSRPLGYDVDDNATRFSNYFHLLREIEHFTNGWLPCEPSSERKHALARIAARKLHGDVLDGNHRSLRPRCLCRCGRHPRSGSATRRRTEGRPPPAGRPPAEQRTLPTTLIAKHRAGRFVARA